MRLWVLLRAFDEGGAERQAAVAAAGLAARGHEVRAIVFHDGLAYRDVLGAQGIEPEIVPGGKLALGPRLAQQLRHDRPDAVLSYLAGPNVLAAALSRVAYRTTVVWGIRSMRLRGEDETLLGRTVQRVEPWASRLADAAVTNSHAARADALARGVRAEPFAVIPNAIDLERWRPRPEARAAARARLGLAPEGPLIGRIGRIHPVKDLPTMLRALASVSDPTVELAVVGRGPDPLVADLEGLARSLGLDRRVHWLGGRTDLDEVYGAFDLTVSSSAYGESMPNAVLESLACGVPCIGTDLGATRDLIDDPRFVVPPEDPVALSEAINGFLALPPADRVAVATTGCRRVGEAYGIDSVVEQLERLVTAAVTERSSH